MLRLSERVRKHDGCIQIYPTSVGWTVRAYYWKEIDLKTGSHKGFTQKRWTGIKGAGDWDQNPPFRLNDSIQEAISWLNEECD